MTLNASLFSEMRSLEKGFTFELRVELSFLDKVPATAKINAFLNIKFKYVY